MSLQPSSPACSCTAAGLGRLPYLGFYLLGGIVAGVTQAYLTPGSSLPAVGASGAVAAVLGAYIVIYPRSRVTMLFPLFFWFSLITVPAYLALGLWFVGQFFNGIFALQDASAIYAGGVAWWAQLQIGSRGQICLIYD